MSCHGLLWAVDLITPNFNHCGFSPHLCVGFLFLILYPGLRLLLRLLLRPPPHFVHTHFINIHFVTTHFVHTHFVTTHFVHNTLSTHTLSTHTLSPHTLSTNTLSTHALSTYTLSPHTLSTHTLSPHTLSTHTLSTYTLSTYIFSTNTLSPHTLSTHTLSTYTLSTYIFSTNTLSPHTLSPHRLSTHTLSTNTSSTHTLSPHTLSPHRLSTHTLSTNTSSTHTLSPHTLSPYTLAQLDIHLRFTWQAWHKLTSAVVLRGRRGTDATGWRPWAGIWRLGRRATLRGRRGTTSHPPWFHVAGVALMALGGALGLAWAPVTPRHFAWQAWHNLTSTFVSRGRRGTNSHLPSFHVAGVALTALGGALGLAWAPVTPRHFAWQAWHNLTSTFVSRGRRGTNSHLPSFHVAGVALTALGGALGLAWAPVTPRHFAWQAWHNLTSTFVSRGRRGTNSHLPSFHVAGVALTALGGALGLAWAPVTPRHFAWQAWHKLTSTVGLRGRRGTNSHLPSFCVAGVALMALGGALGLAWAPVTPRHFAWQAWHKLTSTVGLRGRRGTNSHLPSFHVAGVALTSLGGALGLAWAPVTPRHFAWQAWHNLTSTFVSRGRRGTNSHLPSFHVAGVALMALGGALGLAWAPVTPRHFAWQAWHKLTSTVGLRGRRGTNSHLPSFCVAGVALMALGGALGLAWAPVTPRHFAWQAWHKLTSTVGLRGRRGTNSHLPSFCVAGVALMALGGALGLAWAPVTPRHFAWQAWHKLTSTVGLRGRRGTNSHPPSFCVAGVGQMALGGALGLAWAPVTPRHFAWQAWHKLTSTVGLRGRRGTNSHPPSFCVAGVALMALGK